MKNLLLISTVLTSLLLINCTSGPAVVNSSFWESEQADVVSWLDVQHVESASFRLRRTINNSVRHFRYEGYLFDRPIQQIGSSFQISRGLTNTNFPRPDSSDWIVMFESINHFRSQTGGQNGDYFAIYISSITAQEFDSGEGGSLIMFVIGRFESFGNISGRIWRRP